MVCEGVGVIATLVCEGRCNSDTGVGGVGVIVVMTGVGGVGVIATLGRCNSNTSYSYL